MVLNKDFREFIELLNKHEVKYLVVGGYAVAFHGHPRYTKDIDFWVWLDKTNAENLIKTLMEFGFGNVGLSANDFLVGDQVVQLGYPPNRIDILTELKGVQFDACFSKKVQTEIDGLLVNFIHLDDLKINKRATGRFQDLADIENLEE